MLDKILQNLSTRSRFSVGFLSHKANVELVCSFDAASYAALTMIISTFRTIAIFQMLDKMFLQCYP
jgi:hypothetical protein